MQRRKFNFNLTHKMLYHKTLHKINWRHKQKHTNISKCDPFFVSNVIKQFLINFMMYECYKLFTPFSKILFQNSVRVKVVYHVVFLLNLIFFLFYLAKEVL